MAIRRRPGSSAGSSSSSSYVPGGRWRGFAPVRRLLDRFPGKQTFGIFRFLPLFFCLGATMELVMVKWTVNGANFYKTYKKRQVMNALELEEMQQQQQQYQQQQRQEARAAAAAS